MFMIIEEVYDIRAPLMWVVVCLDSSCRLVDISLVHSLTTAEMGFTITAHRLHI